MNVVALVAAFCCVAVVSGASYNRMRHRGETHSGLGSSELFRYSQAPAYTSFLQFPAEAQVRAAYHDRRRHVPYGGFSMSANPFRSPNSPRSGMNFFSPKVSGGGAMSPDSGGGIVNQRNPLTMAQVRSAWYNKYGAGTGTNYGVQPFSGAFQYYTPPPPSTGGPSSEESSSAT